VVARPVRQPFLIASSHQSCSASASSGEREAIETGLIIWTGYGLPRVLRDSLAGFDAYPPEWPPAGSLEPRAPAMPVRMPQSALAPLNPFCVFHFADRNTAEYIYHKIAQAIIQDGICGKPLGKLMRAANPTKVSARVRYRRDWEPMEFNSEEITDAAPLLGLPINCSQRKS
jgi:hypothetical protein